MKASVTPREHKLLTFIERFQMKNGASPTVKEMREHMRLKSDGFIIHMMERLAKKKFIQKGDTPRSIRMFPSVRRKLEAETIEIPVLGHIPAGSPVIAEEHAEDWITLDAHAVKNRKEVFFLRVRGDSMNDAGILNGDYALVYAKGEPRKGKIVAALVDNESTVKTYQADAKGKPYLQPENKKYKPIYPEGDLQIQGTVIGVFRWYN